MNHKIFSEKYLKKHPLLKWVDKFMNEAKLYPKNGNAIIGVSGGKDSMLLLYLLDQLKKMGKIKDILAIHIDHKLRDDSYLDQELVSDFCSELGIECKVYEFNNQGTSSNFEHIARKKRYQFFTDNAEKSDLIYTAHHIDDSYEWSLISQFKTGSTTNTLGIPLVKGNIRRPFMCLTRAQINYFVKELEIPYREDHTNLDVKYERNYVRHVVIPKIKKKFPGYLKHYVFRANDHARDLNLSRLCPTGAKTFPVAKDKFGNHFIIHPHLSNDFKEIELQFLQIISSISKTERGVLRSQVKRMIEAIYNHKRGPILFSGGVLAYLFHGMIYLGYKDSIEFTKYDHELCESLKTTHIPRCSLKSFKRLIFAKANKLNTPSFYAFGDGKALHRVMNSQKKIDEEYKSSLSKAKANGLWFGNPYKLISKWEEASNKNKLLNVTVF